MPANMKIRSAYSSLPTAERKVADFILENPSRASLMVINEIAAAAGVSVPSVTRLAKKLGYDGFLGFRVALASGSSSLESLRSEPIVETDSDEEVITKTFLATMRGLEDTLKATSKPRLAELADRMAHARRVFIFCGAQCAPMVRDFTLQLCRMGFDASDIDDPAAMESFAGRCSGNDVLIAISRSGRAKQLLSALKSAKAMGCYTAFISNYMNSAAAAAADGFFCTSGVDDVKAITGRESDVTLTALLSALTVLAARRKTVC